MSYEIMNIFVSWNQFFNRDSFCLSLIYIFFIYMFKGHQEIRIFDYESIGNWHVFYFRYHLGVVVFFSSVRVLLLCFLPVLLYWLFSSICFMQAVQSSAVSAVFRRFCFKFWRNFFYFRRFLCVAKVHMQSQKYTLTVEVFTTEIKALQLEFCCSF